MATKQTGRKARDKRNQYVKANRITYKFLGLCILVRKCNTVVNFYFFALTQKSNKKSQGSEKMAKNCSVSLNPANSPPDFFKLEKNSGSNNAGFLTAYYTIFLTPFFRGRL